MSVAKSCLADQLSTDQPMEKRCWWVSNERVCTFPTGYRPEAVAEDKTPLTYLLNTKQDLIFLQGFRVVNIGYVN
jgi:hypothetical protein